MLALNNADKRPLSGTQRTVIYSIIVQIQLQLIQLCCISIITVMQILEPIAHGFI